MNNKNVKNQVEDIKTDTKKDKFKELIFLFLNIYLFISTVIVTYVTLSYGTVAGQVDTGGNYGIFYLATFTVESNILLGLVAGMTAARKLIGLKGAKYERFFAILYLLATTSAMLTFLTVVLFLAPKRAMDGRNYFDMLMGPMFFFHFFNPVIATVGLILFGTKYRFSKRDRLFVMIPPALYAIPYITNVVFLRTWPDFYGFTFGGKNYLVVPCIVVFCAVVYLIGAAIATIHNRVSRSVSKR